MIVTVLGIHAFTIRQQPSFGGRRCIHLTAIDTVRGIAFRIVNVLTAFGVRLILNRSSRVAAPFALILQLLLGW
jgi:hypothetical protein